MQAKIIGRKIVPDRFKLYEQDVNSTQIIFITQKVNGGVDFSTKNAYLNVERDDNTTDKFLLEKSVGDTEIYFSILVNQSLTLKEGIVKGQISFENEDKSEIYKTDVFIFDVIDAVSGNLSFNKVLPSVIDDLENKLNSKIEQSNNALEEVKSIKTEIQKDIENAKNNAVLTVNGKKGNVILDCESIGAMPVGADLPLMQKTKYPITIDGVSFDGTNEVNLKIGGVYEQYDDEKCKIELEDKGVYYASNPSELYISTVNFDNQDKEVSATLYLNCKEGLKVFYSGNVEFCGDDCLDGEIIPSNDCSYKIEFYKLPNSNPVYAKISKYKKTSAKYTEAQSIPGMINADEDELVYNYGIMGNCTMEYMFTGDVDTTVKGVGDLVSDVYDKNYGKYSVKIKTMTNNVLNYKNYNGNLGSLSITLDENTGVLTLNGKVDMAGVVEIPLSGFVNNVMASFRGYHLNGYITTTNLGKHIGIEMYESTAVKFKGQVMGDCTFSNVGNTTARIYYAYKKMVLTFEEESVGSLYNNVQFGFSIELSEQKQGFQVRKESTTNVYFDKQLLGYYGVGDKLDVKNGVIERKIHKLIIPSKEQLSFDESLGRIVYKGPDGMGLKANGMECDDTVEFPTLAPSMEGMISNLVVQFKDDKILLDPNWYGEWEYIENSLPIFLLYALKNPKKEYLQVKTPIKLFKGCNRITIESKNPINESFIRQLKKD